MIELTKVETLAISGGDMECFCIPNARETLGDIDAAICAQACCGWLINAGWDFRGLDNEPFMSPVDFSVKSRPRAAKGSCANQIF